MKTSRFIKWANYVLFILLSILYWTYDKGSLYMFSNGDISMMFMLAPIFTMVEVAILIDSARLESGNIMDGAIMSVVIYFIVLLFMFSVSSLMTYFKEIQNTESLIINILYSILLAVNLLFPTKLYFEDMLHISI